MFELSRVYCLLTVTYWELATRTFLIHLKAFLTYQTKSTSNQRPFSQSRRLLPPSPDRRPKRQNSNEKWWINKRIIYRLLVGFLLCPLFLAKFSFLLSQADFVSSGLFALVVVVCSVLCFFFCCFATHRIDSRFRFYAPFLLNLRNFSISTRKAESLECLLLRNSFRFTFVYALTVVFICLLFFLLYAQRKLLSMMKSLRQ